MLTIIDVLELYVISFFKSYLNRHTAFFNFSVAFHIFYRKMKSEIAEHSKFWRENKYLWTENSGVVYHCCLSFTVSELYFYYYLHSFFLVFLYPFLDIILLLEFKVFLILWNPVTHYVTHYLGAFLCTFSFPNTVTK